MWDKTMAEEPLKAGYRGKARDLGITYVNLTGGAKPDWMKRGQRPPKGIYPKLDEAGLSK